MKLRFIVNWITLILIATFAVGCSHQLKVVNTNEYVARAPYIKNEIVVGTIAASSMQEEKFIEYTIDELRGIGNIKVLYPYVKNDEKPVDYVLSLNANVNYGGSPSNFFISWPGFLIFAPAWHGYNYNADIMTDISVLNFDSGEIIASQKYQTKYKCVQSEFDRTWIELGWLEVSILPFIGGICFTQYDDDITDSFNQALSRPYGNYIARKIGAMLQSID